MTVRDLGLPELKERIRGLEADLRGLAGKLGNRAPEQAPDLARGNEELSSRLEGLESSLFLLLTEQFKPRHSDEALQQAEVLRQATLEYCQQAKIDPELWKNIAF
jgi:hypothetical protein